MEYEDALEVLQARGPGRMVPDLDRIRRLAALLGDPQLAYPSVQVTGTNGKTSVARMVSTLLSAVGLSAGTYTSPHLQTVRERFQVTGRWIGEAMFAEVVDQVAPLAGLVDREIEAESAAAGRSPRDAVTYFELLTAMAFWWFADKPVDVGVFEVGMGGTWDATNLVRGEVSVLAPIDVDHSELGSTASEVAGEKSGIIKPGAIAVSARQADDVLAVLQARADEVGAELRTWGTAHEVVSRQVAVGGQLLAVRVGERTIDDLVLPLHGAHQADNAGLAIAAVAAFLGDAFDQMDDDLVRQGLLAVTSPGRLEVVHRDPTVLLDGAHNPHGAASAAAAMRESFEFRHLAVVLACLDDKDVDGIVGAYADVANHVIVTEAPSPRTATLERMRQAAVATWEGTGVVVETAPDVPAALDLASGIVADGDGILVTGSLYTVGAARDVFMPVESSGDEVIYEPDDIDDEDDEDAFQRAIDEMIDRVDAEREDG